MKGTARHLIADRLDMGGARWGLAGAEAVLILRALLDNGDFEDYWKFHTTPERARNHQARYRETRALTA